MNVVSRGLLLLAIVLSACGQPPLPSQQQAGEGWEFLAWSPSEYIGPSTAAVLTSQGELDEIASTFMLNFASDGELEKVDQSRTPDLSVDFETDVVLAIGSDAVGDCGGPTYGDISFTADQVLIEQLFADRLTCTTEARRSVSLFTVDRSLFPDSPFGFVLGSRDEIIVEFDN